MSTRIPLRELEARYTASGAPVSRALLGRLRRDPRKGAHRLYLKLRKRQARVRAERERLDAMFGVERGLWGRGVLRVAGVDEVGIGPMAGPVVAAAALFEPSTVIDGVDDSKRLDPSSRERLDREIRDRAAGIGIGVVDTRDVDRLNVYHAGLLAMRRAVGALPVPPDHVLVDARTIPGLTMSQQGLPQGDRRSFSVAAASIVAKVYRDRLMCELDEKYPGYGFASHKGYCSPAHQKAVRELGPSPVHRMSFDFIRELRGDYDPVFYDLRDELASIDSPEGIRRWEVRLEAAGSRLGPRARGKLRRLGARRERVMDRYK